MDYSSCLLVRIINAHIQCYTQIDNMNRVRSNDDVIKTITVKMLKRYLNVWHTFSDVFVLHFFMFVFFCVAHVSCLLLWGSFFSSCCRFCIYHVCNYDRSHSPSISAVNEIEANGVVITIKLICINNLTQRWQGFHNSWKKNTERYPPSQIWIKWIISLGTEHYSTRSTCTKQRRKATAHIKCAYYKIHNHCFLCRI